MGINKRAVFFSTDALIALILILLTFLVAYSYLSYPHKESELSSDVIKVISDLKIGEINNSYVKSLISDNLVADLNKSILEQVGEFYITNISLAKKISSEVLSSLKVSENIGIWYGDVLLASTNSSPVESSKNILVDSQAISGIRQGESVTGYSSRAYLSSTLSKKYFYFGGFSGEGNISALLNYTGTLEDIDVELATNKDFDIYINGLYSGHYQKSPSDIQPAIYDLGAYKSNLQPGQNIIKFVADKLYIAGGFIKISYDNPLAYSSPERYSFPGIEGIINLYDGFYIPNNLSSMSVYLHYISNLTLFLNIGNKTVFRENSSAETSKIISDSQLRTLLDYNSIIGKTVPLRLGLEEVELGSGSGKADIVFLIDSTGSMYDEIRDVYDIIENFADFLKNSSVDYRLGLIEFKDYPTGPCGSTGDFPYKVHWFNKKTIDSDADWNSGNLANLSVDSGTLKISRDENSALAETIDQSQTQQGNTAYIYGNYISSQTFIPSISGNITNVTLSLMRFGNAPNIVVEIRNAVGDTPGSTIIASSERGDISAESYQDYSFNFATPTNLASGTKYSIVIKIKNNGGTSSKYYRISLQYLWPAASYANGRHCSSPNNGGSWNCYAYYDLYFTTYMKGHQFFNRGEAIHEYDSGSTSQWTLFEYASLQPQGTSVTFEFRSSEDYSTWSSWYSNFSQVPAGRYIQQKSILSSSGRDTPILDSTVINIDAFTNDATLFKNEVNTFTASGGNDLPESHLAAINKSLDLVYRDDAQKIEILITDDKPHAIDCTYGGSNTDNSCSIGPKYVAGMTSKLIEENIKFFYINKDTGLCSNRIMADSMTNLTGGRYYSYTEAGGIQDIILQIAGSIINLTYSNQTAVSSGEIYTKLYPDSYLQFNYQQMAVPYGLVITLEKQFTNDTSGTFDITENATAYNAKVVSYSGSRWTDSVSINNTIIYNIRDFGEDYAKSGDPYSIEIPASLIKPSNTVKLTTGVSQFNSSGGSAYNKIIYTLIKNVSEYSPISSYARGCIWNIQFEDNTNLTITPENYSGSDNCYYRLDSQQYDSNDAFNTAVHNLFRSLDLNSNHKIDFKFTEQSLKVESSQITGIPYTWKTGVQVRKWD